MRIRRSLSLLASLSAAAVTMGVLAPSPSSSAAIDPNVGSWSAPFTPDGPTSRVIGVHQILMHTGKVLVIGSLRPTVAYVYDPITGKSVNANPPVDIECGAMVALADGRILVVGGHGKGPTGISNVFLFDPITLEWIEQPATNGARYYPTTTLLADGRVVITAGFDHMGDDNTNVDVYTPPAPGGRLGSIKTVGQHLGGLYPRQWLMPSGNVLETQRRGSYILNTKTWEWTEYDRPGKHFSGESAILLPGPPSGSTTAMVFGGGSNAGATTLSETFNAATPTAGWTRVAPLPEPRVHMQAVPTPNGSIIGIGGNQKGSFEQPVYEALSYDPKANTWTTLAAQSERRGYHSAAVLLPGGRILSAGDTGAGGGGNTMETFSPPYLSGTRPTITSSPSRVANGASFTISTPNSKSRAVLMAPGAATHTVDMSARHIELRRTAVAGRITATVPSATVAAPGYYMLFLVNGAGTPSSARWIHIG